MKIYYGREDLLTPYSELSKREKKCIDTLIKVNPDPKKDVAIFAKRDLLRRIRETVPLLTEDDEFLSIVYAVLDGCNPFPELSEDDALEKIKELVWRWFKPTDGSHPDQPQKEIGHQKIRNKLEQR